MDWKSGERSILHLAEGLICSGRYPYVILPQLSLQLVDLDGPG